VNARAPRRSPLLSTAVALLLGVSSVSASAHALLKKSEPAQRAVLSKPPTQVRLWFNESLEPAFSELSVRDAGGKPVTGEAARVPAEDPKRLELSLPPLGPGIYTASYKVLSVDGHTVKGSFKFTVKGP